MDSLHLSVLPLLESLEGTIGELLRELRMGGWRRDEEGDGFWGNILKSIQMFLSNACFLVMLYGKRITLMHSISNK